MNSKNNSLIMPMVAQDKHTTQAAASAKSASEVAARHTPTSYALTAAEAKLPHSSLLIWIVALMFAAFFAWATYFHVEEVSTGTGKVAASSKEQIIQSLEGGVLAKLLVKEGDVVNAGQVLAQLDRTKGESAVEETASRVRAAKASAARLMAEVNGTPLNFPDEVRSESGLVKAETALYRSRRDSLKESLSGLNETLSLVRNELKLTEPLVAKGAASDVEVLRLKRQISDLETRISDTRTQYLVKAREELARVNADIDAQGSITRGRNDSLARATLTSPVRGVVKDIIINTVGGVLPPNGKLMEIVPLGDRLQIEARISPRDIAYIHPNQEAMVKITAYDYSIYGGLKGKVTLISPDTIQDEVKRENYYYRVYIQTETDTLKSKTGEALPIVPGMIATVDIHTGSKSIMRYLIKPINKSTEAMRER